MSVILPSPVDYYLLKTSKLLGFGVEKVIWVSTQSQTVMVAGAGEEMKPPALGYYHPIATPPFSFSW